MKQSKRLLLTLLVAMVSLCAKADGTYQLISVVYNFTKPSNWGYKDGQDVAGVSFVKTLKASEFDRTYGKFAFTTKKGSASTSPRFYNGSLRIYKGSKVQFSRTSGTSAFIYKVFVNGELWFDKPEMDKEITVTDKKFIETLEVIYVDTSQQVMNLSFCDSSLNYLITSYTNNNVTVNGALSSCYIFGAQKQMSLSIPSKVTHGGDSYTVRSIRSRAFYDACGLESLILPSTVTTIGSHAFDGCKMMTHLQLPVITSIGSYAFSGCKSLEEVWIAQPTPSSITLGTDIFSGVDLSDCTLYVPAGSKALYKSSDIWGEFGEIVEVDYAKNLKEAQTLWKEADALYNKMAGNFSELSRYWTNAPCEEGPIENICDGDVNSYFISDTKGNVDDYHYLAVDFGTAISEVAMTFTARTSGTHKPYVWQLYGANADPRKADGTFDESVWTEISGTTNTKLSYEAYTDVYGVEHSETAGRAQATYNLGAPYRFVKFSPYQIESKTSTDCIGKFWCCGDISFTPDVPFYHNEMLGQMLQNLSDAKDDINDCITAGIVWQSTIDKLQEIMNDVNEILATNIEKNKIYCLHVPRGYLSTSTTTTVAENTYLAASSVATQYEQFNILPSPTHKGEYYLYNPAKQKFLSTIGDAPSSAVLDEPDGSFTITYNSKIGCWHIEVGTTKGENSGRWLQIGGEYEYVVGSTWDTYDNGNKWQFYDAGTADTNVINDAIAIINQYEGYNTGIDEIDSTPERSCTIYDLQGRKVRSAHQGVYIVNGRKKVIK